MRCQYAGNSFVDRLASHVGLGLAVIVAGIVAITLVGGGLWTSCESCESVAHAGEPTDDIVAAIQQLQPTVTPERAGSLSEIFTDAGRETSTDPLLLVAIAMRESSLREDIERLERFGSRGERGLMQTHGAAIRLRPDECPATLEGARCQVRTGARWLAYVRDRCPGTPWRWVAAYGMRRCPTEQQAGMDPSTRRARALHLAVGGSGW